MKKTKLSELQLLLTVLSVACLMISNVITFKQVQFPFGIAMTGATFLFPITYVLSDVFSEVYGYRWSRVTCYLAFAMNALMVAAFALAIIAPAPAYWESQEAFQTVLGNAPRVLVASFAAFVVGDLANDRVFKKMKEKYPDSHKGFSLRAIISSLVGEIVDSLIFFPIALGGQLPTSALITMMITNTLLKTGYELVILPVTTLVVKKVSAYEERQN